MKYNGGFDGTQIIPPIKNLMCMKNGSNCGPLSLYMLQIISYNKFNSITPENFGILPSYVVDIVSTNYGVPCSWLLVNENTLPKVNGSSFLSNLNNYFNSATQKQKQRLSMDVPYSTLILGINFNIDGSFKEGHYSVIVSTDNGIQIADPHKLYSLYERTRTIFNNGAIYETTEDADDYLMRYQRYLILQEDFLNLQDDYWPPLNGLYEKYITLIPNDKLSVLNESFNSNNLNSIVQEYVEPQPWLLPQETTLKRQRDDDMQDPDPEQVQQPRRKLIRSDQFRFRGGKTRKHKRNKKTINIKRRPRKRNTRKYRKTRK
jgi:hypothetical protein